MNNAPLKPEDGRIQVSGPITIENVVSITEEGIALLEGKSLKIDLANVTEVDSSVVSMLLEWLRAGNQKKVLLHFINMPDSVENLIQLYGVSAYFLKTESLQT